MSDELTGLALDHSQVVEGMKTEVRQLESLKVGKNMSESEARQLAEEKGVKILTSRWVNTQKTHFGQIHLVLDSLRCVLALASHVI